MRQPAPIMVLSPIVTPFKIVTLLPIQQSLPTLIGAVVHCHFFNFFSGIKYGRDHKKRTPSPIMVPAPISILSIQLKLQELLIKTPSCSINLPEET